MGLDDGTRVITYGNPTNVDLELIHQSDLLKGQVTGEISGTDVTLAGTGFAVAVLFDETSQVAVGTTVVPAPTVSRSRSASRSIQPRSTRRPNT